MAWLDFVVAGLATWRVSSLLVHEEGPYDLLVRTRRALDGTVAGRALACFYCTSLWVAAPAAFWLTGASSSWVAIWLALSGVAILAERTVPGEEVHTVVDLDEAVRLAQRRE